MDAGGYEWRQLLVVAVMGPVVCGWKWQWVQVVMGACAVCRWLLLHLFIGACSYWCRQL